MDRRRHGILLFLSLLVAAAGAVGCGGEMPTGGQPGLAPETTDEISVVSGKDGQPAGSGAASVPRSGSPRVIRIPMRSDGPKSLDPIRGATVYENQCASQIIETLLQYKYLKRPFELEPLLLAEMPRSEDGLTWRFQLKPGVRFHDDPCFPDGRGRELVASDVIYSWKRMADVRRSGSKVWWLIRETIAGLDDFHAARNAAETFDYEAPVSGMKILSDQEFEITLVRPMQSFLWKLAMFQTGIVAREAVEKYGDRFGLRPIGTGPFVLKEGDWKQDQGIRYTRNPGYHECVYPDEHEPADAADGLLEAQGRRLPLLDQVDVVFYKSDQPMWLEFLSGRLHFAQVPAENFEEAFNRRTQKLTAGMKAQKMKGYAVPLLDFMFRGFNLEDPLLGGYTPEKKALRQAICLALDWDEQNEAFYNGINIVFDGVVPPGLDGYPEGGRAAGSYRGPDRERARALLEQAGYPGGRGLPTIDYYTSRQQNAQEQAEMIQKQLSEVGITLRVHLMDFSQLMQKVDERAAQFFSFAWGSDYPDAENNLALFYGPNAAPGANHFNYRNAEYDRLYEQIVTMPTSPERQQIVRQMQQILMEDCPYAGSMARTRFYVVTPGLKNFKPVESFENWYKYLDVAD